MFNKKITDLKTALFKKNDEAGYWKGMDFISADV